MLNPIRTAVSRNKRRYKENGFDLDLAYITNRIIAMGFPSEHMEGLYRNPINEVVRFLDLKHQDHYKVYNLCSERFYDPSKFHGPVAHFPFDDHNAPPFEILHPFCVSVKTWLNEHPENIVVIHCKAGKGRTGVMVCAYLLFERAFQSADDVLKFYGNARTWNGEGVTIPSQIRYIHYWEHTLSHSLEYKDNTCYLSTIELCPPPKHVSPHHLYFAIYAKQTRLLNSKKSRLHFSAEEARWQISFRSPIALTGDIKLQFYEQDRFTKETVFQFWFNTNLHSNLSLSPQRWCFEKHHLDKANKDHRRFSTNFHVVLHLNDTKPFLKSTSEHFNVASSNGPSATPYLEANALPSLAISKSKGISLSVPLTLDLGTETEGEPDLSMHEEDEDADMGADTVNEDHPGSRERGESENHEKNTQKNESPLETTKTGIFSENISRSEEVFKKLHHTPVPSLLIQDERESQTASELDKTN